MAKAIASLIPWLREREGEIKELRVLIKRNGFAYRIKIPQLQKEIYDITNNTRAPKSYFGFLLLNLAKSYGLDGGSGILVLRDEKAVQLAKRILDIKLSRKGGFEECLGLIKEFRRLSFEKRLGILFKPSERALSKKGGVPGRFER
ncbi:MAG: hypothetical protein DRO00_08285 [Thermoproteota archaeon]|nr:MAG: hypothetical protein DRO00_08285 [Candidatus Korarchaeota archaeon]